MGTIFGTLGLFTCQPANWGIRTFPPLKMIEIHQRIVQHKTLKISHFSSSAFIISWCKRRKSASFTVTTWNLWHFHGRQLENLPISCWKSRKSTTFVANSFITFGWNPEFLPRLWRHRFIISLDLPIAKYLPCLSLSKRLRNGGKLMHL